MKDLLTACSRYFAVNFIAVFSSIVVATAFGAVTDPLTYHDPTRVLEFFPMLVGLWVIGSIFAVPCALIGSAILMFLSFEYSWAERPLAWIVVGAGLGSFICLLLGSFIIALVIAGMVGSYSGWRVWKLLRSLDPSLSLVVDN